MRWFTALLLVLCFVVLPLPAATVQTANFVVTAPTQQAAEAFGEWAEYYRKERAMAWLGQEMPRWSQPCPLKVTVTEGGAGGATSFGFDGGRVHGQSMHIEGPVRKLISCVLPHEVTHTVFAYRFGQPVPRWLDEGSAVMSEDDEERARHDRMCRDYLNQGRAIPLRTLASMREYPRDVMALYAEGYCVSNYLVGVGGRQRFLEFIRAGMASGWDNASKSLYGFQSIDDLEQQWLQHLRDTKGKPVFNPSREKESVATVEPQGNPPAVATLPGDPNARLIAALDRVEKQLSTLTAMQRDIADLKSRLDRLEGKGASIPSSAPSRLPAGNLPPLRTPPTMQPISQQRQAMPYAQPSPYVPSQPYGWGQPYCPPGGT